MIQKTQFPFKFDADSFREALFVLPENVRTAEYREQLAELEAKLHLDTIEKHKNSSAIPEIIPEYAPSSDKTAEMPIEILPQALPIAPESARIAGHNKYDDREEWEENLATAQAE
jgi:hypothetical protein